MLPKCKACGKEVDRKTAYKITEKEKNLYYCSEEEYNKVMKMKQTIEDIHLLICDIFGQQALNRALSKEWNLWREITNDTMILRYLRENKAMLSKTMQSKDFYNERASIRYFSAILKNNLKKFADTYTDEEGLCARSEIEIYESKKSKTPPRRGFADIEAEVV